MLILTFAILAQISLHVYAGTTESTPTLKEVDAENACKGFEGNWTVTRKAYGSTICGKIEKGEPTPWWKNCNTCATWRMLVWRDNACEKIKNDHTPCAAGVSTKAGNYYCGHTPCGKDGKFPEGGKWNE